MDFAEDGMNKGQTKIMSCILVSGMWLRMHAENKKGRVNSALFTK